MIAKWNLLLKRSFYDEKSWAHFGYTELVIANSLVKKVFDTKMPKLSYVHILQMSNHQQKFLKDLTLQCIDD